MATSCPIKFHTAAKPDVKRKSDNDAQTSHFFQSDIWADIYVVFIGPSHFLSAKPIKPTVFKNSGHTKD
jgi:hypothetical protein